MSSRHLGGDGFLDRHRQVIVEARAGGAIKGAEAQHDAFLVGLDAIEAAGEPEQHHRRQHHDEAAVAPHAAGHELADAFLRLT